MILVDTTAWVDFDRATGSTVDTRLSGLIADDAEVAVTEPVIMEVTVGARTDARERDLRSAARSVQPPAIRLDAAIDFDAALRIYRTCRRSGVTPRGMVDCTIASVARRNNATLLASDADRWLVARTIGIPLDDDHL